MAIKRLIDAARGARGLFPAPFAVFVRRFPLRLRDREDLARLFAVFFGIRARFSDRRKRLSPLAVPYRICR